MMSGTRRIRACVAVLVAGLVTGGMLAVAELPAGAAIGVSDLDHGVTAQALAESLVGGGLSVSNVTYTGANAAAGSFNGGVPAIGFPSGIVLGSGRVQSTVDTPDCARGVEGPNTCTGNTTAWATPGDADLTALAGVDTNDAAVLGFDFVPQFPTVQFDYVFSSDEYNEFANTGFNDVFGFFVNGTNCATVGDPAVPVSVNTINGGNPLGTDAQHPELFRNNEDASIDTEMDGLTTVLQCNALVTPNVVNHMKLAIADGSDSSLDSNVFIRAGSLVSGTALSGSVSGNAQSGTSITVPSGTQVTGSAVLDGVTAATATGSVAYGFVAGASCDGSTVPAGTKTVAAGVVPNSDPITLTTAGVYSLTASYSGDGSHNASALSCGAVTVTVTGTTVSPLLASLAPISVSTALGGDQVFTLTATRDSVPEAGHAVSFAVTSGPDVGSSGVGSTDALGHATFSVHGTAVGTDVVTATVQDGASSVVSNDASVAWTQLSSGGVTVTGSPEPPTITAGSAGLVHFVITNAGPGALDSAVATVVLPDGVTPVSLVVSRGSCAAFVGQQAICSIGSIGVGETVTLDIVAQTPPGFPASPSLGILVTLSGTGIDPIQSSAGSAVVAPTPGEAIGFVPPGGTISTGTNATPENNTVASFTLPNTGTGAPITLRAETEGVATFCGGKACSGKILFLSPFEGYTNPRQPARLKITWDKSVAGRGTRSKIYVRKQVGGPIVRVRKCENTHHHIADPSPCIYRKKKLHNGDIRFEILLLSGDPYFARR